MLKRLFLMFAAIVCAAALPARAQSAPDRSYRAIPPELMMSLVRKPGEDGAFAIRLAAPYGTSGCPRASKIGYSMSFQDIYLAVVTQDYAVDMNDLPDAPQYECAKISTLPAAEIPLTLKMLKDNNTQHIRFEGPGRADYYDIQVSGNHVRLVQSEMQAPGKLYVRPAPDEYRKDPLSLWFYPKGTLILRADAAEPYKGDISGQIEGMARARGLEPLKNIMPEFTPPLDDPDSFYYVDKSGRISGQPGMENGVPVGTVGVPVEVFGLDGDQTAEKTVQVYAYAPGDNE